MKSLFVVSSLMALTALGSFAQADTLAPSSLSDDLVGNLYLMKSVYRAEYAPAQWKQSYANYNLDTQFDAAVSAAQANPNLTQANAREILKNFIYAMKDYHTSIRFVSTEDASLAFSVKGTADRFFIMYIDRTKLSEAAFPFHVGDELVTFDGVPAAQAVAAVQAEIPANVPATDKALAEIYLTHRAGARGYVVPQGPITIGVKAKGSDSVQNLQLIWDYTPEKVQPRGNLTHLHGCFGRKARGLSPDHERGYGIRSERGQSVRPRRSQDVHSGSRNESLGEPDRRICSMRTFTRPPIAVSSVTSAFLSTKRMIM